MKTTAINALAAVAAALAVAGCGGSNAYGPNANGAPSQHQPPPPPPGGDTSVANALNASTFIVGSDTSSKAQHATLYLVGGNVAPNSYAVVDLGGAANVHAIVKAINAKGDATGYFQVVASSSTDAFLYSFASSSLQDLGPGPGNSVAIGFAIDDNDEIAGYTAHGQVVNPLFWSAGSGYVVVSDPVGGTASQATGINNSQLITGVYSDGVNDFLPFYSTVAGPPTDLAGIVGVGFPHGINNDGVIVGSGGPTGGWTYDTGTKIQTNLPNAGAALPLAINDLGVVAGSDGKIATPHAYMWKNGKETDLGTIGLPGVVDLNTKIAAGALQLPGDYLEEATGINASGQICCNTHFHHAVILTPGG